MSKSSRKRDPLAGVTVIGLADVGLVHNTIAEAVGESAQIIHITPPAPADIDATPLGEGGAEHDAQVRVALQLEQPSEQADPVPAPTPVAEDKSSGALRPFLNHIIRVVSQSNPKLNGSEAHRFWAFYEDGMTVTKYLDDRRMDRRRARSNINWDVKKGFIRLEAP